MRNSIGDMIIEYNQPVFRPPAESKSLILQVTIGCSWNKCTFCEMYQDKSFTVKSREEIENELQRVSSVIKEIIDTNPSVRPIDLVRDVFLADGDAMTIPQPQLLAILQLIQTIPTTR